MLSEGSRESKCSSVESFCWKPECSLEYVQRSGINQTECLILQKRTTTPQGNLVPHLIHLMIHVSEKHYDFLCVILLFVQELRHKKIGAKRWTRQGSGKRLITGWCTVFAHLRGGGGGELVDIFAFKCTHERAYEIVVDGSVAISGFERVASELKLSCGVGE